MPPYLLSSDLKARFN